ncbi:MAG: helix-turn-helix transcriptional regulator [Pricia sp.]
MVNSSDFIERLEYLLEYYGINASAFADKIHVQRSSISHLLSGRNKPSLEFVLKVVKNFPEVNLYWLLNGKGSFPSEEKTDDGVNQSASAQVGLMSDPTNETLIGKHVGAEKHTRAEKYTGTGKHSGTSRNIERIVIFYSDGSFEAYTGE